MIYQQRHPYIKHTDNGNEQTDKNGLFNTIRYLSTETATYLIHLNLLKWPLGLTKDKKIIHNFVNFQTSQKVMFVYPFPASRANKELILYPDNKKIKHAWSNPEQNIWISQWYQRPKKHTQKPMYINLF